MVTEAPPVAERVVLDSFALIAYLTHETPWQMVEDLLSDAMAGRAEVAMCVVNLGEVYYRTQRQAGVSGTGRLLTAVRALPIAIVPADWELTQLAADLKAVIPVAYADCFAAALAIRWDAELVTGDPEFRLFGDRVRVRWLPKA